MKSIGKAAEFVRKVAGALRRKAAVLRARLLFLASPRRRMAVVARISRHIRALTPREKAAAQSRGTAVAPPQAEDADDGEDHAIVGLPELARLFEQVDADPGYPDDWALTLRSQGNGERRAGGGGGFADVDDGLDGDGEEPSVIDVIRSRREGDGVEFRIEEEIDQAADMYIARVRRRIMNITRTRS